MDDTELQAIRRARLAELQKNSGQSPAVGSSPQNSNDSLQSSLLSQLLEPQAKERLSRVNMVRPDRAKAVENYIAKLAQTGQLRRKMTEPEIVEILNGIARDQEQQNQTKIVFDRKNGGGGLDSDDDDDFFD